jgi:hypothetical protein
MKFCKQKFLRIIFAQNRRVRRCSPLWGVKSTRNAKEAEKLKISAH